MYHYCFNVSSDPAIKYKLLFQESHRTIKSYFFQFLCFPNLKMYSYYNNSKRFPARRWCGSSSVEPASGAHPSICTPQLSPFYCMGSQEERAYNPSDWCLKPCEMQLHRLAPWRGHTAPYLFRRGQISCYSDVGSQIRFCSYYGQFEIRLLCTK